MNNRGNIANEKEYPKVKETSISKIEEREKAIFEEYYLKVAETAKYQSNIKKAITFEKNNEDNIYFEQQYEGMTDNEIMKYTYDEEISQYKDAYFSSSCSLKIEDQEIAIYIGTVKVGYVPNGEFAEVKRYIYDILAVGGLPSGPVSIHLTLRGGKYKISYDNFIQRGEANYKLDGVISLMRIKEQFL